MSILPNLLRSLILTAIFSFLLPIVFIGTIFVTLILLGYVPKLEIIGSAGVEQVTNFLTIFGSGSAIQGVLTIAIVASLVGVLFDMSTFYRHQNFRDEYRD
ncbi:MAG TPA: hypothetical protein V6C65_16690 [Allocoleopsis sp.]